jgi:hypothetical protein
MCVNFQILGGCASFTAGGCDDQVADDGRKHATPIGDHPGILRVQGPGLRTFGRRRKCFFVISLVAFEVGRSKKQLKLCH